MTSTVIRSVDALRKWRAQHTDSIGLVMTMGCLHAGHAALLRESVKHNDITVLTIFTNPTQFNQTADFESYPQTIDADITLAEACQVDVIFVPSYQDMYPDDYRYRISETQFSQVMEGAHRPGHFEGMLTIVSKMMILVRATRAYFGEKDYQQLQLVRGMTQALFMETEVVGVPTVREPDQLALSSRNTRLRSDQKPIAARFPQILLAAKTAEHATQCLRAEGFDVEYIEEYDGRRLGAVCLGGVRLIDNVVLKGRESC